MFITESEVARRLRTEENVLVRLARSVAPGETAPLIFPVEILSPESEEVSQPTHPLGVSEDPSPVSIKQTGSKNFDRMNGKEIQKSLNQLLRTDGYAGRGTKALHRDTQAAIGVTAGILGTTKAGRLGDVALSQAHSYERGYTDPTSLVNPAKGPKEELREKIIEGHGIVVDACFQKLMKTLDVLDDEKLNSMTKPVEITLVAKNLSGIIAHATQATQEKNVELNDNNVHFHIMRPERAQESEYPIIEVNSEKEETKFQEHSRES